MKTIIKKILMIYISLVLIFAPSSIAYAVSPAGWSFSAYNAATSVVTAIKGGASASVAVAKSPITAKIAKGIVGGAIAGAVLPLAISQISGIALEALDWVLDPKNNAINYKAPAPTACYITGGIQFTFATTEAESLRLYQAEYGIVPGVSTWAVEPAKCGLGGYKTIPIPTVADKIYDNAKTDTASASIVNDAVKDYVNSGAADVALDNAKADADATHGCGTGTQWNGSACVATPSTPSTPTTPDTPFDPSSIIDAINSVFNAITDLFDAVMSIPDVINTAIDDLLVDIKDFFQPFIDSVTDFFDSVITKFTDFIDWVKQEPPQEEPPKNVPVGQLSDVGLENQDRFQARIKFPAQCPSQQLTLNYFGRTYSHEIPLQALCQVLEMVAPVFVGVACLGVAFYIVREV